MLERLNDKYTWLLLMLHATSQHVLTLGDERASLESVLVSGGAGDPHSPDPPVLVAGVPGRSTDGGDLHRPGSGDGGKTGSPPPVVHHRDPRQPGPGGPVWPAVLPQSCPPA